MCESVCRHQQVASWLPSSTSAAASEPPWSVAPTHRVQSAFEGLSLDGEGGEGEAGERKMLKRPGRANVLKRYLQRGLGAEAQKVFLPMVAFRWGHAAVT